MTALTRTDTLSREITSCVGTSITIVRRSTRTICWIPGTTMTMPGPLTFQNRPSRKITPRSYSRRILIALKRSSSTIARRMIGNSSPNMRFPFLLRESFGHPGPSSGQRGAAGGLTWIERLDVQQQPVDASDPHALPLLHRHGRACPPALAVDADGALADELLERDRLRARHLPAAAD